MLEIPIGRPEIKKLRVIGAGLRHGHLPPAFKGPESAWHLTVKETQDLAAFQQAGWQFRAEPDLDWSVAKELNGDELQAGLLARHPNGGLVIITNHLVVQLPSDSAPPVLSFDGGHLQMRKLPVGTDLFDVTLPLPSSEGALHDSIGRALNLFNVVAFDGEHVAEPLLIYHLLHPGRFVDVDYDPEIQLHWDTIKVREAWREANDNYGTNTRVAVIDVGFYLEEPQIALHILDSAVVDYLGNVGLKQVDGQGDLRYVDASGNTIANEMPKHYHGTYCAGLVGALRDDYTVHGAAPDCRLLLVAVPDVVTPLAVAAAIKISAQGLNGGPGADVISCSLGVTTQTWDDLRPLKAEIDTAHTTRSGLGTVIVWADFNEEEEIPAESLEAYDGITCVGPSDACDERITSGYGPGLDLLAPGDGVVGIGGAEFGASCSAPIVAGVAALVIAVDNTLDWKQITDMLLTSCDPDTQPKKRIDDCHGWGRINALHAIKLAMKNGASVGARDTLRVSRVARLRS